MISAFGVSTFVSAAYLHINCILLQFVIFRGHLAMLGVIKIDGGCNGSINGSCLVARLTTFVQFKLGLCVCMNADLKPKKIG